MTSDPGPVSIDVTWTLADARAWGGIVMARHAALAATVERTRRWGQIIALGGAAVASGAAFLASDSPTAAICGAILGYLLTVAGQWGYHWDQRGPSMVDVIFQKDPRAYEPRRFVLTDIALTEQRPGLIGTVEWGRIDRLTRESGLIIVWITNLDGLPIPERCFPDTAQADAFIAGIEQRMASARSTG